MRNHVPRAPGEEIERAVWRGGFKQTAVGRKVNCCDDGAFRAQQLGPVPMTSWT